MISNSQRRNPLFWESKPPPSNEMLYWAEKKSGPGSLFGRRVARRNSQRSWKRRARFASASNLSAQPFQWIKVNNGDESEQMKSNKTGSHITGRATNGHWNGSNSPPPLCLNKNGGKAIRSGKKKSKKKSKLSFCPKHREAHQHKCRSWWNFTWQRRVTHFNGNGQFFCEKALNGPEARRGKNIRNNLNLIQFDFLCGGISQSDIPSFDLQPAEGRF